MAKPWDEAYLIQINYLRNVGGTKLTGSIKRFKTEHILRPGQGQIQTYSQRFQKPHSAHTGQSIAEVLAPHCKEGRLSMNQPSRLFPIPFPRSFTHTHSADPFLSQHPLLFASLLFLPQFPLKQRAAVKNFSPNSKTLAAAEWDRLLTAHTCPHRRDLWG